MLSDFQAAGKYHGSFDLLDETLNRTNLGDLNPGDLVNLERSVPATGRMGGHFVTGHIDVVGEVEVFEEREELIFPCCSPAAVFKVSSR